MAQQGYGPPTLPVGTEVSAKYRGAFCEAKVKTVSKIVKCKLQLKDSQIPVSLLDDEIKGPTKIGAVVEVKHPTTGQSVEATVLKLLDQSLYTVVFDDGDERTLRRTQLCLKGDRHFIESETLDNLPLSHPEHFGTPVLNNKKARRKADEDNYEDYSEEESPRRTMYRGRYQELVGKLFLVELPNRKGSAIPALVVLPDSTSISEVKRIDQILVRSFKDSKYLTVNRKQMKDFSRSLAIKNEDKTMRTAFEKALLYFDTKELPVGWKREDMLGSDVEDEEAVEDNEYASEDEPFEEKDRFVAQLYKFMDERGTPINKGPCIGNKDLNLYKLFKIVQNLGGYNKVTKEMKWHVVYSKMGLPSLHQNPAHQVKMAYKKYLDAYEAFYRKLGNSMGTHSRPGRVRQNTGRSILNYRSREKSPRLPRQVLEKKEEPDTPKAKVEVEKSEDSQDSTSVVSVEETEPAPRRTTQRRERLQNAKERDGSKDKEKKEKEDTTKVKDKKDEIKLKKEETATSAVKVKKDEVSTPVGKGKKEDVTSKAKTENSAVKKEEKKPVRKPVKVEEEKDDKNEKKPIRAIRKEKEETPAVAVDSAKKRLTRRKLLTGDKEDESKDDDIKEDKKEPILKKALPKDSRVPSVERKEIPRTLERRDSKSAEKKPTGNKAVEFKPSEKKAPVKLGDEKKIVKREKKGKEEDMSDGEEKEESNEEQKQEKGSIPKIEYPVGTKLRVKYGKGKNQKMYIAKVVDTVVEGPHRNYLVHYAGWNMRYDEWIRGDRVASILDKATVVDKPDMAKKTDAPKAAIKVHKPLSSIKRLNAHHQPMMAKKPNQIFRTPKVLTAKTRATRSSSSEASSGSPNLGSDKRTTRRRSVVAEAGEKGEESQQSTETEHMSGSQENIASDIKNDPEEDAQLVDIEDEEDEDDSALEKNELDTSLEDDGEENEEVLEDKVKPEDVEMVKKEQLISESEEDTEVKEDLKESSESAVEDVKNENEEEEQESVENDSGDMEEDEELVASATPKQEKSSVMMAEVIEADNEITSALVDDIGHDIPNEVDDARPELTSSSSGCLSSSQESEKEEKSNGEDSSAKTDGDDNAELSEDACKKEDEESTSEEKILDYQAGEEDDKEEGSSDQNIPLLKKVDVDNDRSKPGKSRKKDAGKDSKKLGKSFSSDASNTSTEIPTLEPIVMSSELPAVKSSPSPYDFDEAETENQWQPELSKKWDTGTADQAQSRSKESTPVSGDMQDKEKKKVKKKTKKKISSPQFVSDSKSEEASSSSSQPNESVSNMAESNTSEDRLSEKQSIKKKGRKRKEMSTVDPPKSEVVDQYGLSVNSVVEAVKHSLREESPERESSKPTPKKRRLKRVSESDKRDMSRASKPERRRGGLRDSQDTVEALNVEGSKGKSDVHNQSLLENVMMLTSRSKQSSSQAAKSSHANDNTETKRSNDGGNFDEEVDGAIGTQQFLPQLGGEDRPSASAHYENTPPTTPEHEEGESCAASSHQQTGSASPCSDDLANKSDSFKDGSLSSSSSNSLPVSSSNAAPAKSNNESPSEDNDVGSTTSNDNLDNVLTTHQGSESSGTEQDVVQSRKRKQVEEPPASSSAAKKKKRVHGTRSRTAKKSPKYVNTDSVSYQTRISDCHVSSSSNQYMESPLSRLADIAKSPRPSKYNFNADLGEYLEGEERCNFLIAKMKEIKSIYMNLKSEVASIDRRRKRIRRKERESSQASPNERESVR